MLIFFKIACEIYLFTSTCNKYETEVCKYKNQFLVNTFVSYYKNLFYIKKNKHYATFKFIKYNYLSKIIVYCNFLIFFIKFIL